MNSFVKPFQLAVEWLGGGKLPVDVRRRLLARAVVLLAALAGIKAVLLLNLSSHLFQTHYRIFGNLSAPALIGNSCLFVGLLLASFIELGRQSGAYARRDIGWFNVWFVLAGLVFVFLSLHQGEYNYIQPVMDGTLGWLDLRWYLSLNLFFGPPWLACYLVLYPLIYRGLVSIQREGWSFYVLGGIAAFYLVINLKELMYLGEELVLINCIGAGALISLYRGRSLLSWRPAAVIIVLAASGWLLFAHYVSVAGTCFVLIFTTGLAVWGSIYVLTRRSTVFPVLAHFLPFYLAAFCLLSLHNYPLAENDGHMLVYGIALPHYFWQEITMTGLLLVLGFTVSRSFPRMGRILFDFSALALILVTLVDFQLNRQMGFRLDWNAVTVSNNPAILWRTIRPYAGPCMLAMGGIAAAYFLFVALAARPAAGRVSAAFLDKRSDRVFLAVTFGLVIYLSPMLLGRADKAQGTWLSNIVETNPYMEGRRFKVFAPGDFTRMASRLGVRGIPPNPPAAPNGPEREFNVLLIVMESSYNRYLSLFGAKDETEPLLKKYRDRMELFPNFYSVYPNSFHARFSVFSGIYPTKEYVSYINPRIECQSLFEILHDHGWKVSVFDSCYGDYARLNDYMRGRKLDFAYDANTMPERNHFPKVSWGVAETATAESIKTQMTDHVRRNERFFLTYTPVAPHAPFDTPDKGFAKFNDLNRLSGDYTGRYKNQLLYMDWIITGLIDKLDELQILDNTLVIITNDHGEMVGEDDGLLGHGWCLKPILVNTPLIIMNPLNRGYRVNYTLGSQIDVLPTMLDLLNIPVPAGELYQGASLYNPAANQDKVIYFDSYSDRAMIAGNKYYLSRPGAPTAVFDISNDGVKTSFTATNGTANMESRLKEFEQFQNSFIVHYSHYKQEFSHPEPVAAR